MAHNVKIIKGVGGLKLELARFVLLILLLITATIADIKNLKINNTIIFPSMLFGLILNTYYLRWDGFKLSFAGLIIPFALLFVLYILKMLGAGDIKLFCSVGAIIGSTNILWCIMASFLIGGILALLIMLYRGNGMKRLKRLYDYLLGCFLTLSFLPYQDFKNEGDGHFPFAVAITLGTLGTLLIG